MGKSKAKSWTKMEYLAFVLIVIASAFGIIFLAKTIDLFKQLPETISVPPMILGPKSPPAKTLPNQEAFRCPTDDIVVQLSMAYGMCLWQYSDSPNCTKELVGILPQASCLKEKT